MFAHSKTLQSAEWSSIFALVKWEYKLMFVPKMIPIVWGWSSQTMQSRMKHQNSFTAFPASWKYTPPSSTNGTGKWSENLAKSKEISQYPVADFEVKHVINFIPDAWLSVGWWTKPVRMGNGWKSPFPSMNKTGCLVTKHFRYLKWRYKNLVFFSRVYYCWKPCWIKQDLKGYTTNKTPTDLKRKSFQESSFSDANCES